MERYTHLLGKPKIPSRSFIGMTFSPNYIPQSVWLAHLPGGNIFTREDLMDLHLILVQFSSVQLLGHVYLFVTPWTIAHQASLSITKSQSLLKLMSTESLMTSKHLILCHPLFLLPPIFPSFRAFSNESALLIRWPKYWNFSFNSSPSNEYSGLISFRMDCLDLLVVQETVKSLLQHHS